MPPHHPSASFALNFVLFNKTVKQISAVCYCTDFISGACRSNEGAGEEQHDQEVGKGRGETEPAGSPVGATGGAHPEDRPRVVPVPVLRLVPVLKTK